MESPLAPKLCVELFACMIHIPPGVTAIVPEFQLFTFVRLYNITKVRTYEIANFKYLDVFII